MEKEKLALAGFFSGTIQCIIGHPFDTKKSFNSIKKYISIDIKKLIQRIKLSIIHSEYCKFNNVYILEFLKFNEFNNILSGGGAGFLTGLILTPIELLKINKQVNINS